MRNMKTCFITTRNIFNTACLPKYRNILNGNFDIIYWDQHGIEEYCGAANHYKFDYKMIYGNGKINKVIGYMKFKKFVEKILIENDYDKLIILPTQAGLLLSRTLNKKYKNNYIIDIRDYTAEFNKVVYKWEEKLIKNSGLAIITSPAYEKFLPKQEYCVSHNTTAIKEITIKQYREREKVKDKKIIISCIGSIRFIDQFKLVIDKFKNDRRFEIRFIGRGSDKLEEYIKEKKINNVKLIGRFDSDKTLDFYLDTDIIMNLYGNKNPYLDYALSNKLYYAATLGIPILVSPLTYMEELSLEKGFGISGDLERENLADYVFNTYVKINWKDFFLNCDKFMLEVNNDERNFIKKVSTFLEK